MTEESEFDSYFEALREDLPSSGDEARIRRRLASAGMAVTLAAAGKTAAAGSAAAGSTVVAKVGLVSALSVRFASLPLLAQLGMVTAGTTALATGPVAIATHVHRSNAAASQEIRRAAANAVERQAIPPQGAAPRAPEQQAKLLSPTDVSTTEPVHTPPASTGAPTRIVIPAEPAAMSRDSIAIAPESESALAVSASETIASPFGHETTSLGSADSPQSLDATPTRSRGTAIAPTVASESLDARNLSEETRLIDNALTAIRARDLSLAARLLDEHATRFPHARLWREQQRVRQKLEEARNRADAP